MAVPFTTPALQGSRARPAERGGLEIIVPNPSGGRGVYILPWSGVCQLCRPTVHDTLLSARMAALRNVTPAAMRQVAGEIAAEGLAGRTAQAAAGTAAKGDREDRLTANFLLLLALIEQVHPAELGGLSVERVSPRELEQRARSAVARVGPKLGRRPEAVAEALEQIAEAFAGIGAPRQKPVPRIIRLLDALSRLRADMLAWNKEHAGDSAARAEMIDAVADLTIACARRTLADAHALASDHARLAAQLGDGARSRACRDCSPGVAVGRMGANLPRLAKRGRGCQPEVRAIGDGPARPGAAPRNVRLGWHAGRYRSSQAISQVRAAERGLAKRPDH